MGQHVNSFQNSSEEKPKEYPKICYNTKFSKTIGEELYHLFKKFATDGVINLEIFTVVFPFLKNEDELLKSIFRVIAKNGSTIDFEEFITALSTMVHGTAEEKTELTLKILDLNGDQKIEREELLTVCSDVAKILQKNYPENVNTSISAQEIVNKIFNHQMDHEDDILIQHLINSQDDQKTSHTEKYQHFIEKYKNNPEKKHVLDKFSAKEDRLKDYLSELDNKIKGNHEKEKKDEKLSFEQFRDRAKHEHEFLSCFGLFTLFNLEIIKPIEKQFDTHTYKLGYPTVEGEVTVLNFTQKKPYVQVLNGFMNIFSNYKHCNVNQHLRWLIKQDSVVKFGENDEITQIVTEKLKQVDVGKAVSIGIKNSTLEEELINPKIDLYHGSELKAPDSTITKDNFTTTLFAQKHLTGVSAMMSYDIGKSGYSLFILFEVGLLLSTGFFAVSVEESGANRHVVYTKLKLHVKTSGIIEHKSVENFSVNACIGHPNKKDFLTNKICFFVEIEEALEFPPPLYVIDLTEANVKRHKNDSFFLSTHSFKETEFILESDKLLEHWLSTIQKNQEVAKLVHPTQSFSPVRTEMGARFFIAGAEYYTDLKERLKEAKNEILITGWFISPQLHLSRKKVNGKYVDRLDEILLERANAGVLVHICVWDEIDAAFKLGSKQVKEILKHPNINVIRDPLDLLGIWSHHQKTCVIDQVIGYCGGIDLAYNRYETHEYKLTDEGEDEIFVGRDYVNPMIDKENANIGKDQQIYESIWDRKKEPRMPWQDIQLKVVGDCARDLARNFIQRWNKSKSTSQPFLALRSHDYHKSDVDQLRKKEPYPNCNIQIIRSASFWSMGLNTVESSIYQSQIDAIKNSKHFIYIENQFIVTSHSDFQLNPENKLLKAFVERIERAIVNKEKFKFIFVTPVHSSSPMKNSTVQKLTYWQLTSMFHGPKSIFGYFKDKYPDVNIDDYFTICCLRQHGQFKSGVISTEMIYVHSKLMIVDDRIAFISSANVNDRSMLGNRDSEIGARIEDTEEVEITMAGEKFMAKKFAHELRHKLQCLFTGADEKLAKEAIDPVLFYDKWMEIAKNNQKIYVQVFQMIEDNIKKPEDVVYLTEYSHVLLARDTHLLKELQGFVIPYPRGLFSESYSEPSEADPTAKFYC